MAFDAKSWKRTDQAILAGAAVAFISGFLPWYGFDGSAGFLSNYSVNGWSAQFSAWAGILLLTAAGVFLAVRLAEVKLPELPVGSTIIVAGLAGLGLLLVLIRWISFPNAPAGSHVGSKYGIWVAVIAGIVETAAAVMQVRESGEPLPWAQSGAAAASAADAPAAPVASEPASSPVPSSPAPASEPAPATESVPPAAADSPETPGA